MHLRTRLRQTGRTGGYFIEIGAGTGDLSHLLLANGLSGCGFDLNPEACHRNRKRNAEAIRAERYAVFEQDFLRADLSRTADVILCAMVIEHLPARQVGRLFDRVAQLLSPDGIFCVFVPASPAHWGIEDDIAGHLRRYVLADFPLLARPAGLVIRDLCGLTYPLSNLLLPLSNFLVRRAESHKLKLAPAQRTIDSGARDVPYKTTFPQWVGACLNEFTLYPFHLWQRLAANSPNALVIYCEMALPSPAASLRP